MDTPLTSEKQLLADIEQLRSQFQQTQDLYREVCTLMFFRYGMTPTANKLYQLVRKGSMTAPAEALGKFWEDLREKSRVRIEHPDLPEALKTAAGQLAATLWSSAQSLAQESLDSYRNELKAAILDVQTAKAKAESERDAAKEIAVSKQEELLQASERINQLNQQLSVAEATSTSLELQLTQAQEQITIHQQQLDDTRHDFSAELEKLRATSTLAEKSFRANEVRMLVELDRERTTATKLQKELDAARSHNQHSSERHYTEVGNLRQKNGLLEGQLKALSTNKDVIAAELSATQLNLTNCLSEIASLRNEIDNLWRKEKASQQLIRELKSTRKSARANEKKE